MRGVLCRCEMRYVAYGGCVMKVEFESVLFGLAFLALALISMPGKGKEAATPQASTEQAAATSPATGG